MRNQSSIKFPKFNVRNYRLALRWMWTQAHTHLATLDGHLDREARGEEEKVWEKNVAGWNNTDGVMSIGCRIQNSIRTLPHRYKNKKMKLYKSWKEQNKKKKDFQVIKLGVFFFKHHSPSPSPQQKKLGRKEHKNVIARESEKESFSSGRHPIGRDSTTFLEMRIIWRVC